MFDNVSAIELSSRQDLSESMGCLIYLLAFFIVFGSIGLLLDGYYLGFSCLASILLLFLSLKQVVVRLVSKLEAPTQFSMNWSRAKKIQWPTGRQKNIKFDVLVEDGTFETRDIDLSKVHPKCKFELIRWIRAGSSHSEHINWPEFCLAQALPRVLYLPEAERPKDWRGSFTRFPSLVHFLKRNHVTAQSRESNQQVEMGSLLGVLKTLFFAMLNVTVAFLVVLAISIPLSAISNSYLLSGSWQYPFVEVGIGIGLLLGGWAGVNYIFQLFINKPPLDDESRKTRDRVLWFLPIYFLCLPPFIHLIMPLGEMAAPLLLMGVLTILWPVLLQRRKEEKEFRDRDLIRSASRLWARLYECD